MERDIIRAMGPLLLGSRLKRLGERLQGEVTRVVEAAGLPVQPSQYPALAALDWYGPMTVTDMVDTLGLSQPAVTRLLARLTDAGLVQMERRPSDQRHKTVALTESGQALLAQSKRIIWPRIEAAVIDTLTGLSGPLLDQVRGLEQALATQPLDARCAEPAIAGMSVLPFSDELAPFFYDINAQWIEAMFRLEPIDVEVLRNPYTRIIEPGGDILFLHLDGIGVAGTCALQKTGERQFELTKMGVLDAARGRKAGEVLLRATLRRAGELGAEKLYLLTSSKCQAAIHLYEKNGFVHNPDIMRDFGARYARCDVAMRYAG